MSRMSELEARRLLLLQRCEAERLELAYRLEQIRPAAQLSAWTHRTPAGSSGHPFAWIAGLVSLLMMFRRRRLLGGVTWLTGLVALATRATTILRVIAQTRALYAGLKARR